MSEFHSTRRDHVLRRPIERAIQGASTVTEQAEAVLRVLDEHRVITYLPKGMVRLLTPQGRVLVALIEHPGITLRELAVLVGTSESNTLGAVNALVRASVITKTKVRGRNHYRFDEKSGWSHPDIVRFSEALRLVAEN
jgi:hypothetical protein